MSPRRFRVSIRSGSAVGFGFDLFRFEFRASRSREKRIPEQNPARRRQSYDMDDELLDEARKARGPAGYLLSAFGRRRDHGILIQFFRPAVSRLEFVQHVHERFFLPGSVSVLPYRRNLGHQPFHSR